MISYFNRVNSESNIIFPVEVHFIALPHIKKVTHLYIVYPAKWPNPKLVTHDRTENSELFWLPFLYGGQCSIGVLQ